MSGLHNRGKGVTKLMTTLGPSWISASFASPATGTGPLTGSWVVPVPFPYYRVLMCSINLHIGTACSNNNLTLTLQAVKPSSGAVSTTPFTAVTAALTTNAISSYQITFVNPVFTGRAAAVAGQSRTVTTPTGAAWAAVAGHVMTGGLGVCSTVNDTSINSTFREIYPEFVMGAVGAAGTISGTANVLIEPFVRL